MPRASSLLSKAPLKTFSEVYYRLRIESAIYSKWKTSPILIWQMGKVGSSTIHSTIRESGINNPLFHIHALSDELLFKGELYKRSQKKGNYAYLYNIALRKSMLQHVSKGMKWKIISSVRDPVSRNISAFFQNLDIYFPNDPPNHSLDISKLTEVFIKHFDHLRPIKWFDIELKDVLGFDIYTREFDRENGYTIYHNSRYDILVMRMEDMNQVAPIALKEFLDTNRISLAKSNVGSKKSYADLYRRFKDKIKLSDSYLNTVYDTEYCRFFYSKDEIEQFREYWRRA